MTDSFITIAGQMELTRDDFPQLKNGDIYMDWTGAALPPEFLIRQSHQFLSRNLLGNPHSHREASSKAIDEIMETRHEILDYLNAPPSEYEVIFTMNATNATLLLQHYKFSGGELLLTADNHNSVNGLREIARQQGAVVRYAPVNPDLSIDECMLMHKLEHPRTSGNHLFCYPAKSNYTGHLHPLEWVKKAKEHGWNVLLDAAAFLANDRLDVASVQPDFIPVSFYKIFGFPTGIGCLVIRRECYEKMYKRWFSGGSILIVSVKNDFYAPEAVGYARYEDGTVNFGLIPAVRNGLKFMKRLGNVKNNAVECSSALYDRLKRMRSGDVTVDIHNARGNDIICFSIRKNGNIVNPLRFEQEAIRSGVYVRTGCFCNPGINEKIFGYSVEEYEQLYDDRLMPEQVARLKNFAESRPLGAIRVSFGYANTLADIEKFASFTYAFLEALNG
ncbi:MAG: aminotransferase class V-fold PLP-dependent enzyme [Syntrophothermus sp.]